MADRREAETKRKKTRSTRARGPQLAEWGSVAAAAAALEGHGIEPLSPLRQEGGKRRKGKEKKRREQALSRIKEMENFFMGFFSFIGAAEMSKKESGSERGREGAGAGREREEGHAKTESRSHKGGRRARNENSGDEGGEKSRGSDK